MKLICLGDSGNNLVKRTKVILESTCPSIRKLLFYFCSYVLSVGSVLSFVVFQTLGRPWSCTFCRLMLLCISADIHISFCLRR